MGKVNECHWFRKYFRNFLWEKKKVTDFLRAFHITIKVVLKLS